MAYPKTIGACIDLCYDLRAKRLEIEKKADTLKEEQKGLEEHIIQTFDKTDIDGAKGSKATAAITRTTVPSIIDYAAFAAYILKTKQLDLLERRASKSACQARWDDKVVVPGVEPFVKIGLSLTKSNKE